MFVFTTYNTVIFLLLYYIEVISIIMMFYCFVMLVILLYCVLWCGFVIFLYSSVQTCSRYSNDTKVLSSSQFLYQRQQSSPLTGVHNRHIPRHYLVTMPMTHSFPASMTHAAQNFSRSHNAPIPQCFSQHKPTLLFTCLRHRHNPRMSSVTTQLPKVFPTALLLSPSVLYSIIISHT